MNRLAEYFHSEVFHLPSASLHLLRSHPSSASSVFLLDRLWHPFLSAFSSSIFLLSSLSAFISVSAYVSMSSCLCLCVSTCLSLCPVFVSSYVSLYLPHNSA